MNAHLVVEFYNEDHLHVHPELDKVFYSLNEFSEYLRKNIIPMVCSEIPTPAVYYTVKVYGADDSAFLTEYTQELLG